MNSIVFKVSRRVYIIFGIMFGWMPISISILAYFKGTIESTELELYCPKHASQNYAL